jgi:hypothetical protein
MKWVGRGPIKFEELRSGVEEERPSDRVKYFSSAIQTVRLRGGLENPEHGSGVPKCAHE